MAVFKTLNNFLKLTKLDTEKLGLQLIFSKGEACSNLAGISNETRVLVMLKAKYFDKTDTVFLLFGEIVDVYWGNSKSSSVTYASTQYVDMDRTIKGRNCRPGLIEVGLEKLQQTTGRFKLCAKVMFTLLKLSIWELQNGTH